jgi:hypothetical protein
VEDRTLNWRDMPEFTGVDLEDSWVLGWQLDASGGHLLIELEASLWPGHAAYGPPAVGEYTCYRQARLIFEGVRNVSGLREQSTVKPYFDPDGELDYGSVDALERVGEECRLVGPMGDVTLHASALRLEVAGADSPAR